MLSLLTFPTLLFVLISVSPLFIVFRSLTVFSLTTCTILWKGRNPLYSRLFLQIQNYYFSEILHYNVFLPVKAHSVIMNYGPLHSSMMIMIQELL